MKNKIIILLILTVMLINNVSASMEHIESGEFSTSGVTQYSNSPTGIGTVNVGATSVYFYDFSIYSAGLQFMSITVSSTYFVGNLKATHNSYYENIQLKSGANVICNGKYGYYKTLSDDYTIYLWLDLETWDNHGLSGTQTLSIFGISDGNIFKFNQLHRYLPGSVDNDTVMFQCTSPYHAYVTSSMGSSYSSNGVYSFYNLYDTYLDGTFQLLNYSRDVNNKSKITIKDYNNNILYTESILDDEITEISSYNLSPWFLNSEDVYGNMYYKTLIFDIDEDAPTLTTDKTYYNTSEIIEISYTNIDKIYEQCTSSLCNEPYQLWIYALNNPNIPKFRQWLYSDRRDEIFILNTSILAPQTEYQLMITSGENNIVISSDIFYVYPDDEYLSISCDANANCITANKAKNTFYYKINNNSNIIVKDNDNNIISTYYNIIGTGSIIYTIPDDLEHINTYPNWKVYLNNTEYSTSFNKEMVVYWSLFVTPTPTPTYTPQPTPDINISDTIDEFKTETQPIKDLIFGLSEIVIDNPDYNKDNIVDESEINHWFNSLIPICIIFLLVVLYIGLKKKRE